VSKLVDATQEAGFKTVRWNGRDDFGQEVSSGVYVIQLIVNEQRLIGKITLQK
jgi:flagellar hook assembly protein FlgD